MRAEKFFVDNNIEFQKIDLELDENLEQTCSNQTLVLPQGTSAANNQNRPAVSSTQ